MGDAHFELQAKIEEHRSRLAGYGPGMYVYWFLAHHFAAEDIRFADVGPDPERSRQDVRSGRIFLVTERAFVVAEYSDAAVESEGNPQGDFGTIDLELHPREPARVGLAWPGRTLRVAQKQYGNSPPGVRLSKGALTLRGQSWQIALPGEDADDGDDYVERLRSAVGL